MSPLAVKMVARDKKSHVSPRCLEPVPLNQDSGLSNTLASSTLSNSESRSKRVEKRRGESPILFYTATTPLSFPQDSRGSGS